MDMDPLSAAASVADVAARGSQLSRVMYDLTSRFREIENEISGIANDLSLSALALNELEGVLREDSRVYRRRLVRVVNEMLSQYKLIFQSISKTLSTDHQDTRSSKQFRREVLRYFQRHHVRPLQAGIKCMRSTLEVMLHIVHLARVTEAVDSLLPYPGSVSTHPDVQGEGKILVRVILDNRQSILCLKQTQEHRDEQIFRDVVDDKRGLDESANNVALDDGAAIFERNLASRDGDGLDLFPDCKVGSSANTSTKTDMFSKTAKISGTDTTCGNARAFGDNMEYKNTATTDGLGFGNFRHFDNIHEADKAEESRVMRDDDFGSLATTVNHKHNMDDNHSLDSFLDLPNSTAPDLALESAQAAADESQSAEHIASCHNQKAKQEKSVKNVRQKEVSKINLTSRDLLQNPGVLARPSSYPKHAVEPHEIPKATLGGGRPRMLSKLPGHGQNSRSDDLLGSLHSSESSLSASPSSEYYSIPPDALVSDTGSYHPQYNLAMKSTTPETSASAEGVALKKNKGYGSPSRQNTVTPTVQWLLSVVPHESGVPDFIEEPYLGEGTKLNAQAERTAKTLLVNWTNVDPDLIFGEENPGAWTAIADGYCRSHNVVGNEKPQGHPYQVSYTPQVYPTFAPQQWYPVPVLTGSPLSGRLTDKEDLARLKKLILDEKAEQDARAVVVAAATPPPASLSPFLTEEHAKDTAQHASSKIEAVDSTQRPQEHNTLLNAKPPRQPPVIMRDWLGRKFIFPVDVCQTWEGLHSLIQEAFGHMLEYRATIEKGCYSISHVTGEGILPSTWKLFVQPGLEINIEIWNAFDADRDECNSEAMVGGRRDEGSSKGLIPPPPPSHTPKMPRLERSMALRIRSDSDPSFEDVPDEKSDYPFHNEISHVGRPDTRYQSIENVLLEQKKATTQAKMKLEHNRRIFQLKQRLAEQGAEIQARQYAAEHAEQDCKLAWLEKQVRDQKDELDRLPPLLMTPPNSSDGNAQGQSTTTPQRKASFGARLLGRMPSRSIRSRGST